MRVSHIIFFFSLLFLSETAPPPEDDAASPGADDEVVEYLDFSSGEPIPKSDDALPAPLLPPQPLQAQAGLRPLHLEKEIPVATCRPLGLSFPVDNLMVVSLGRDQWTRILPSWTTLSTSKTQRPAVVLAQ